MQNETTCRKSKFAYLLNPNIEYAGLIWYKTNRAY
nr:MAG TPA: hypothetical protein [Caudoviricetes sp.]